jgi:6-pyruvoyltetrahydropterin/6-carboxytetrahydropterin synthase
MGKEKPVYRTFVETSFSAAHQLKGYKGACGELHGHTWTVRAEVETDKLDKLGMTIDFKDLKRKLDSVVREFDHRCINQRRPFIKENPTAENLAKYIYLKMGKILSDDIKIIEVTVLESPNYGVKYSER